MIVAMLGERAARARFCSGARRWTLGPRAFPEDVPVSADVAPIAIRKPQVVGRAMMDAMTDDATTGSAAPDHVAADGAEPAGAAAAAGLPTAATDIPAPRIRRLATRELTADERGVIRAVLDAAFGPDEEERFTDHDWEHAIGGTHVVLEVDGAILAHASVVERELRLADVPVRTGYVEAVAVDPHAQGRGYGTAVMREVGAIIQVGFALGALGTGSFHFYERLGWRSWRGPSSVRTADGDRPTPDDDGYLMVLATPRSPVLDLDAPISCAWRSGDVW
jgi:aminoglycoside 2'-N-acetyltransferase I